MYLARNKKQKKMAKDKAKLGTSVAAPTCRWCYGQYVGIYFCILDLTNLKNENYKHTTLASIFPFLLALLFLEKGLKSD